MAKVERVTHKLQLDEDLALHEKGWKFQRIGWFFLYALVALAAIGMFGNGMVSGTRQIGLNSQMEYDRFHRFESRMELKVRIKNAGDNPTVGLQNAYLEHFKVETVVPEPSENFTNSGMVYYKFNGSAPIDITFYLVPQDMGQVDGVASVNGQQFQLSHFIFP